MMGDGEHVNNVIRTGCMDDVGTRLQFLTELYELWRRGSTSSTATTSTNRTTK